MLRRSKNFHGINFEIENPAGTTRAGRGFKDWSRDMQFHYGFIPNTLAVDGDEIDVFFPPHKMWSTKVYVIHQRKRGTDEYDEDKLMVGFEDWDAAKKAYRMSYGDPDLYMGPVTVWEIDELKEALKKSGGEPGKLDGSARKKWLGSGKLLPIETEDPTPSQAVKDLKHRDKQAMLLIGLETLRFF